MKPADRRVHLLALCLATAVSAATYLLFEHLSSAPVTLLTEKYTQALVAGQFHLQGTDDPGVREQLYDASPFHGRYYLYFGVVPFATVLAPVLAATGRQLSDAEAILGYALGTSLCLAWLLGDLARRYFPRAGPATLAFTMLLVSLGSGGLLLVRNPNIYELVVAAAWFHGVLTLCFASTALHDPRRSLLWLGLAGLNAGLVVGCRPDQVSVAAITLAFIFTQTRALPGTVPQRNRKLVLALLPLGTVALALMLYNWVRFDSPLEFGFRYQPSMAEQLSQGILSWRYIPTNLWHYLVGWPHWTGWFPYFEWPASPPFPAPPGYFRDDQAYGLIVTCPAMILASGLFVGGRLVAGFPRTLLTLTAAGGLLNLLLLSTFDCAVYRYTVNFLPYFTMCAAWGLLSLGHQANRWWTGAGGLLAVGSVLASFSAANALYDLTRSQNPDFFSHTAHLFNLPRFAWERLRHAPLTKIRARLQLPLDRYGNNEPLLVTGRKGLQNFLYLNYAGPGYLRVGFEAMGRGGPVSDFLPIDYHQPITIDVILGDRWPPAGAAVYGNLTPASIDHLRRRVMVNVNGNRVLDAYISHHPVKDIYFWGLSPDDLAFGSTFSGKLLGISALPVGESSELWSTPKDSTLPKGP